MFARFRTNTDAAEFERIGLEYEVLQTEATSLIERRALSSQDLDRLLAITDEQIELHEKQMALLKQA
ncbi:MAG: hypothetical protein KME20_10540 [Kaiparowitsia implicata GSE-PSE-MK54-09C]|jgi:hypothetical protein|nr:hypothetical protein [Kaiparowitsia implicata GSE-PSE-MK54-09C]